MLTFFNLVQGSLSGVLNDHTMIFLWAFLLSVFSMAVYRLSSPQKKLLALKDQLQKVKDKMQDEELMEEQSLTVAKELLGVSLKRMWMTFLPALLSGIPIILMWGFLAYHFDRDTPNPGDKVAIDVSPTMKGLYINDRFVRTNGSGQLSVTWPSKEKIKMNDPQGQNIFSINSAKPEYYLNKWQWWNMIIRSPYGYIDNHAKVNEISLQIPMREYFSFGPWWLRSWCTIFVVGMVFFSLSIKFLFKIE